jgi:hypothetical protein
MSDTHPSPITPSSDKKEDPKVIHADYIIIDSNDHSIPDREETQYNAESLSSSKGPFALRLICLVASFCCLILSIGFLIGTAILGFGSLLFLFRNPSLNKALFSYMKLLAATIVATFGFLVGVISPLIGFTLLFFYFSMTDSTFFKSILKKL